MIFSTGFESNLPDPPSKSALMKVDLAHWNSDDWAHRLEGVDYVFHLAACKHHVAGDHPLRLWQTNVDATYALLQGCRQAEVKRVVFASSLYVYGRRELPPMAEEERIEPTTLYGISKLTGERLMDYFSECSNFTTLSLRLFFVYGPGQNISKGYPSVIVKTARRLLSGQTPLMTGDGSQQFDYVFIDDVVEAFLKEWKAKSTGRGSTSAPAGRPPLAT
jgi:UDP-glucose 4-epimerase